MEFILKGMRAEIKLEEKEKGNKIFCNIMVVPEFDWMALSKVLASKTTIVESPAM